MQNIVIRRSGTMIDISPDGRAPLPQDVAELLVPQLYYVHTKILRGAEAYEESGKAHAVKLERRNLFRFEEGRLTTGYGFIPKITRALTQAHYNVRLLDLSPPRQRPNCYRADWENLARFFTPRAEAQMDCLRAVDQTLGGIIDAAMGFGKSHMMAALCHLYPYAKIAIVCKPVDVVAKTVRRLTATIPNVGQIGGGCKRRGDRVTVFTADSAHLSDGDFDFLFCDEVHQLMSPTHATKLAEHFRFTRNYGFSGTPDGRMDGAGARLEMYFGPKIFKLSYPDAVKLGLVVPLRVRWLKCDGSQSNPAHGKQGVPRMRWGIWRNDERNAMFAADVRKTYPHPDTQILMAVATLDHAFHLWKYLPEFTLCYSGTEEENMDRYKKTGLIPPNFQRMTTERRNAMRDAFEAGTLKRVIATDVWSTGVDFEQLQVIYRCDARESVILDNQWPARPSRLYEGKDYGEIVDSIDCFDETFKRKSQARRRHYLDNEWTDDWPWDRKKVTNG